MPRKPSQKSTSVYVSDAVLVALTAKAPNRKNNPSQSARQVLRQADLNIYEDQGVKAMGGGRPLVLQIERRVLEKLEIHAENQNVSLDYVVTQFIVCETQKK